MTDTFAVPRSPIKLSPTLLTLAGAVILAWFALVLMLGARGTFIDPPGRPTIGIMIALLLPPLLFLGLIRLSPVFRRQVLAIDPIWIAAVMGLRILGMGFLFLYAFGHLPGLFAHPAGWGDIAVALLAPFMAARLARHSSFLASPWYWRYHLLGMLDFVGAVGIAMIARSTMFDPDGALSTTLGGLPLVLIPAFAVPLFICLHLTAFLQVKAARQAMTA